MGHRGGKVGQQYNSRWKELVTTTNIQMPNSGDEPKQPNSERPDEIEPDGL